MRDVGTAAAIGLAAGIFGGVIGFFVARVVVENFAVVEGAPAGVLFVLLISGCTVVWTFIGFILAFWRLRKAGGKEQ